MPRAYVLPDKGGFTYRMAGTDWSVDPPCPLEFGGIIFTFVLC